MISKSSLAEIKEFHHVLSQGHKKSNSDDWVEMNQGKKDRIYQENTEKQFRNFHFFKVQRIKT